MTYLFYTANSFNSILTIDGGKNSIVKISEEKNLNKVFIVEKNPSSFPTAFKALGEKLVYGIEFIVCENIESDEIESIETEHKIIIFAKTGSGWNNHLMKLYSTAYVDGHFKGVPRLDFKMINKYWDDDLLMMIPFYDSFIYNNLLKFSCCNISLKQKPLFCLESHDLPYDNILRRKVTEFADANNCDTIETHKVCYRDSIDIIPYQTYKCVQNKSDMEKPNLDGFASDKFCIV